MSTDGYVRIPHYQFVGYDANEIVWGFKEGTVWLWVTSDGNTIMPVIQTVLREIRDSQFATARMPEGFTTRLVREMYRDGWDSVLLTMKQPEEGYDHSYTVDFMDQSVTVHGRINNKYSFKQVREGRIF